MQENSIKALMQTVQQELGQGVKHFVILVSSPGGIVAWGLTAYNFLKGIPARVDTHNFGSVDSVALVLYCAGEKRCCVPHARFLMHGVGFTISQKTRFEEKQLHERMKSLKMDTENIAGVIAENTGKEENEILKAMYEGTVLNPEQAVHFRLAHETEAKLFESGAKVITIS